MTRASVIARRTPALLLTAALAALPFAPAVAQETRAAVDVSVGGGYSTNPFLIRGQGPTGSFSTELAIAPQLTFLDERDEATLKAQYRRSDYLTRYSAAEAYGVSALARRAMSETVNVRANLSLESSIIGQNGLGTVGVVDPTLIPIPGVPGIPGVPSTPDITVIGLNQRQTSIVAGVGADWRMSVRDTIDATVSISRINFGSGNNNGALLASRTTSASLGYSRALSERTSIGVQGLASWINYDQPGFSGHTYAPQGTLNHQFTDKVNLQLGLGVLFVSSTTPFGTVDTTGLSANLNACRNAGRSTQCVRAYSDAQPTGLGDVSRRFGGAVDYSYRLRENDVLRGTIDYSRVTTTSNITFQAPQVSFANATASYERGITRRVFAGASVGYRQAFGFGVGDPADVSFRLFLRTRLGDRR